MKKSFVATLLKGFLGGHEDAYNFYLSQLRITIEQAFGVLVHRWAILREPLVHPILKVSPLVLSLIHLHNFCIDQNKLTSVSVPAKNLMNLAATVKTTHLIGRGAEAEVVELGKLGLPVSFLGCGHHFNDAEINRQSPNTRTPMDDMITRVKDLGSSCPKYHLQNYEIIHALSFGTPTTQSWLP